MRKRDVATILLLVALGLVLLVAGCAQLDKFFTPDPVTGVAPSAEVGKTIEDVGRGLGLSPWGEIASGALALFGGAYLLIRKIRKAAGKKVAAK